MVVSTRAIAEIVQGLSGAAGPRPDGSDPPAGMMACDGLRRLGVRFGGQTLLEQTIAELVAAVRLSV